MKKNNKWTSKIQEISEFVFHFSWKISLQSWAFMRMLWIVMSCPTKRFPCLHSEQQQTVKFSLVPCGSSLHISYESSIDLQYSLGASKEFIFRQQHIWVYKVYIGKLGSNSKLSNESWQKAAWNSLNGMDFPVYKYCILIRSNAGYQLGNQLFVKRSQHIMIAPS